MDPSSRVGPNEAASTRCLPLRSGSDRSVLSCLSREAIVRLEAPRGELFYLVRGGGQNMLERVRIKTPTFSGIPAMMEVFKGSQYADAPAILASFDPCMSCTAK